MGVGWVVVGIVVSKHKHVPMNGISMFGELVEMDNAAGIRTYWYLLILTVLVLLITTFYIRTTRYLCKVNTSKYDLR